MVKKACNDRLIRPPVRVRGRTPASPFLLHQSLFPAPARSSSGQPGSIPDGPGRACLFGERTAEGRGTVREDYGRTGYRSREIRRRGGRTGRAAAKIAHSGERCRFSAAEGVSLPPQAVAPTPPSPETGTSSIATGHGRTTSGMVSPIPSSACRTSRS